MCVVVKLVVKLVGVFLIGIWGNVCDADITLLNQTLIEQIDEK